MRRKSVFGPVPRPFHAGLALAALLAGCTVYLDDPPSGGDGDGDGDVPTVDAGDGDGDGDGDGTIDAGTGANGEALFTSTVLPLFDISRPLGKCTDCHVTGTPTAGPKFLGADEDESYDTLIANVRWVPDSPAAVETCILHSRGLHMGDALCTGPGEPEDYCDEDEVALVKAWLTVEAGN